MLPFAMAVKGASLVESGGHGTPWDETGPGGFSCSWASTHSLPKVFYPRLCPRNYRFPLFAGFWNVALGTWIPAFCGFLCHVLAPDSG